MDELGLRALLDDVQSGAMTPDDAVLRLRRLPFADVDGATVDHHRHLRSGLPEAIYGPGKSPAQCVAIVAELLAHGTGPVLLTRTDDAQRLACVEAHGPAVEASGSMVWRLPDATSPARIAVVTAGTSDIPVADEAALALRAYGFDPTLVTQLPPVKDGYISAPKGPGLGLKLLPGVAKRKDATVRITKAGK